MHDLIVANFILCVIGCLICFLRARELSPSTKLVIRCRYLLYFFVLGGSSEVLDLGRARRLFSPAQRKAMAVRDRRCRVRKDGN